MNLHRIAAVALALASAPLAAQPGETVPLRFGWEPGMRAAVAMEHVRVRVIDGQRDSTRMASTYRVEVVDHPQGLALAHSDLRWAELPDMGPELGRIFQAMAGTSTGGRGQTLVSDAGDFLRVVGAEALAAELQAALEPTLAQVDGAGLTRLREAMSTMLSPQTLNANAADEWNVLVGTWVDTDLDVGETSSLRSSFQTPVFAGVDIPLSLEFRLVGRTHCTEAEERAGGQRRCVELEMRTVPDPQAVSGALRGFMERAGLPPEQAEMLFAQMAMVTDVSLVTEPGTLRPHRLRVDRVITAGEEEGAPMQLETRTLTYRYAP